MKKEKWTKEDEAFLIKNYGETSGKFVAEKLNRTVNSVKGKAKHLGLITYTPNKWTEDELTFLKTNYETLGRKIVAEKLNRPIGSVSKKTKELGLKFNTKLPKITKEELIKATEISYCYSDLLEKLNQVKSGASMRILKRNLVTYNIDTSHFDPYKKNKENCAKGLTEKFPMEHWLQNGSHISSSHLKPMLYKEGLKQRECEKCGQGEEWRGEHISLILDHINGVSNDNRLENLRILCPNCNAALPTHCRGHKRIEKAKQDLIEKDKMKTERIKNNGQTEKQLASSISQRKAERPSLEVLLTETKELGFLGTGRKYGVSDNAIRKWIKTYEKHPELI